MRTTPPPQSLIRTQSVDSFDSNVALAISFDNEPFIASRSDFGTAGPSGHCGTVEKQATFWSSI